MNSQVAILDYGLGNVKSMFNAVEYIGAKPVLTDDRSVVLGAKALIIPGVGAFGVGMQNLRVSGLNEIIHDFAQSGKKILGVCLGMQMLLDVGYENGEVRGLGMIAGAVRKFAVTPSGEVRIPHVGWNEISKKSIDWHGTILQGLVESQKYYFVHSFVATDVGEQNILSRSFYGGIEFVSGVVKDNVYGVQFHPEKSSRCGLKILENFCN